MVAMDTPLQHAHQRADDAEIIIKKKLRAHIIKILKKITHGDRPVPALHRPGRLLSAIPGWDSVGRLASVRLGAGLLGSP
jgi:hypothetical protein